MDHLFDEFSKSLAESVPRRESLRRLGAVFAGAVLSPLGLGTAWAGRRDPCSLLQMWHGEAAVAVPGGLPGVQRQHRPHRRILREIRLLPDRRLRRGVQRPAARPELRGLRKQLPRPGEDLLRRSLRRPRHRRLQLRELRNGVRRASSQRIRRVRLRHVRLRLRRRRHPLQRHLHLRGFGSRQLRSLRQRLWRIDPVLLPAGICTDAYGCNLRRCLHRLWIWTATIAARAASCAAAAVSLLIGHLRRH